MTGEQQTPDTDTDEEMVQATIDSLIHQRERAQNESAEYMARGQILSKRLKDAEGEVLELRKQLADRKKPDKSA